MFVARHLMPENILGISIIIVVTISINDGRAIFRVVLILMPSNLTLVGIIILATAPFCH